MLSPFFWKFLMLSPSFKVVLIHSLGTLAYIDRVSILKSSVSPIPKRGGLTGQSKQKHASVYREMNPSRALCWLHRFKDKEI